MSFHDKVHSDAKWIVQGGKPSVIFGWFFTTKGKKKYLSQVAVELNNEDPQRLTDNNLW